MAMHDTKGKKELEVLAKMLKISIVKADKAITHAINKANNTLKILRKQLQ